MLKKINQQIVKYLHTVKEVIEAVNITFTADDGTVKEGLATKRKMVYGELSFQMNQFMKTLIS